MPLFVYDMNRLEQVIQAHRDVIVLLHNHIRRLEQFQLNQREKLKVPDNTAAILLPESDICIFRFKIEYSAIEWVTRQFDSLKNYDFSQLAQPGPVFIAEPNDADISAELKKFALKNLT